MQPFLAFLRTDSRLALADSGSAWTVRILKSEYSIDVVIPHDVLERSVTVSVNGSEVWSDWIDYYATAGETRGELRQDMERDVMWFFRQLLASHLGHPTGKTRLPIHSARFPAGNRTESGFFFKISEFRTKPHLSQFAVPNRRFPGVPVQPEFCVWRQPRLKNGCGRLARTATATLRVS